MDSLIIKCWFQILPRFAENAPFRRKFESENHEADPIVGALQLESIISIEKLRRSIRATTLSKVIQSAFFNVDETRLHLSSHELKHAVGGEDQHREARAADGVEEVVGEAPHDGHQPGLRGAHLPPRGAGGPATQPSRASERAEQASEGQGASEGPRWAQTFVPRRAAPSSDERRSMPGPGTSETGGEPRSNDQDSS